LRHDVSQEYRMRFLYVLEISCIFHTCFHYSILALQDIHLQIILQVVNNKDQIVSQLNYANVAAQVKILICYKEQL